MSLVARFLALLPLAPLLIPLGACGSSPTSPGQPPGTSTVRAVAFYDASGAGVPPGTGRLPQVQVAVGGITAVTDGTGRAVLSGVPDGSQTITVRPESLPPFFVGPAPRTIQVPSGGDVLLPVTLPIGSNLPTSYMGFGDSITVGDGSSDGNGYRVRLETMLAAYFGQATVIDQGVGGSLTGFGARRLVATLSQLKPAYTLIQYGTNDYSNPQCSVGGPDPPCPAVNNLRKMVRDVRAAQSLPFLATIIPAAPDPDNTERNQWVSDLDDRIRAAAREEGAVLVDLHAAFLASGNQASLYSDALHPNDGGYEIMAQAFFRAITQGTVPPAATIALDRRRPALTPAGPDFVPGAEPRRAP